MFCSDQHIIFHIIQYPPSPHIEAPSIATQSGMPFYNLEQDLLPVMENITWKACASFGSLDAQAGVFRDTLASEDYESRHDR